MSLANEKPHLANEKNVGATAAGATPQPKAQAEIKESGYDLVEKSLPDSEHKHLARWVQRYNLSDDDPMFGAYLAARVSFASAAAASQAAVAVQSAVGSIEDRIFDGARLAGEDVKKVIENKGAEVGQSIVKAVTTAGMQVKSGIEQVFNSSIGSMRLVADSAAEKAQAARDAIVQSGVQEYRKLAAQAIENAMAGYRVERRKSAFLFGAFVVGITTVLTCFFTVSALEKMGYIAPHPIQIKSGHRNCGVASVGTFGPQYICVLDASIHPAPPVPAPQ
ncbi:hypothetical protein [Acidithiobacillus caldus]|uniref:Uncharacterized protein n=2 Tax=Acidithiobacillus caldus TaxID=33059 RepID=A0A1E7YQT4_9PROT|nr:hypothetical protein [Acidithiobacillus caldus]OFC38868.1 hypothetical protein BAE27_01120 [Acidithiobacillus caldus]OFC39055.1 hypothetical protein BAE28_04380 [Acidithiobacillus caldus]